MNMQLPVNLQSEHANRLALVRHLADLAMASAGSPEPTNVFGLLQAHDASELFLLILFDALNVAVPKKADYMDYFGTLDVAIAPKSLPLKERMRRMSQARVALKHQGLIPAAREIKTLCEAAVTFLEMSTEMIFGNSLASISLAQHVEDNDVRSSLLAAEAFLQTNQPAEALYECGLAFDNLMTAHKSAELSRYGFSVERGDPQHIMSSFHVEALKDRQMKSLRDYIDKLVDAVKFLDDRIDVMDLGIDLGKLRSFRKFTPRIIRNLGGHNMTDRTKWVKLSKGTDQNARECIELVTATALRYQQRDK